MKNRLEDDNELFYRIANNDDREAFTHLYERYYQLIYSLALFYLKNKEQAEDALQHTFMKFWEQRRSLGFHSSVKNYLFTMTKNYVLNLIRNNLTALEKNYEVAQESSMEEEFESSLLVEEQNNILRSAINRLTPTQQLIIHHKLHNEYNHQEIATQMNLSINTVKTHYRLAIKSLRGILSKKNLLVIMLIILLN